MPTSMRRSGADAYNTTHTDDPVGNRLVEEADGQRTTYSYDAANQLTSSVIPVGLITTYAYDEAVNLTDKIPHRSIWRIAMSCRWSPCSSFWVCLAAQLALGPVQSFSGLTDIRTADLIACTPDNTRLLIYGRGASYRRQPENNVAPVLQVWDPTTDTQIADLELPVGDVDGVAISPDGAHVAVGCGNQGIVHIYDVESGQRTDVEIGQRGTVRILGFTSQSDRLTYATTKAMMPESFVAVDIGSGKMSQKLVNAVYSATSSPIADELVVIRRLPNPAIQVITPTTAKVKKQLSIAPAGGVLAISPDGQFIATGDSGPINVIDLDAEKVVAVLRNEDDNPNRFTDLSISSGARWLAAKPLRGGRPRTELWNVETKKNVSDWTARETGDFLAGRDVGCGGTSTRREVLQPCHPAGSLTTVSGGRVQPQISRTPDPHVDKCQWTIHGRGEHGVCDRRYCSITECGR